CAPLVMRFSRTRGVRPMLSELSANIKGLYLPIRHKFSALFPPRAFQVGERSLVENLGNRHVYPPPYFRERRLGLAPHPGFFVARAFDKTQHLAHFDGLGRPRKQVATLRAAPRF